MDTILEVIIVGISAGIIGVIIGALARGNLKKAWYNFFRKRYVEIEIIHDGIVRDTKILSANSIKNNEFKYKGVTKKLTDVINPTNTSAYSKRFTFVNDSILPNVNVLEELPSTLTGINSFEILTKRETKDKSGNIKNIYYVMTSKFWMNLLEHGFVDKIKKEKKNPMEAILEFMQSPSGTILIIIAAAFILMQVASSLHLIH